MPKSKNPKLTPKQEKFVDKYLELGNGTKAAKEAGYSARTADKIASENIRKPEIMASIAEKKEAAAKKAGFTLDFKYKMLKKAAELALLPTHNQYGVTSNADVRGLVAVIDITNKMNGHYEAVKSEVNTEVNNDGLKELISQIKKDY